MARSTSLRVSSRSDSVRDFLFQRRDLAEPADRQFDRRDQVGDGERLHQVGHRPGVACTFDQVALAERGQHHDRRDALAGDLRRGVDPVAARHLHVHDHQVGFEPLGQLDGLLAVACLADDVVALLAQHLGQIHADESFVFGDQDPARGGVGVGVGRGAGHDAHCVVAAATSDLGGVRGGDDADHLW